jgi:hypothetical protein
VAKGRRQCFACNSLLEARYLYCPFCGVRLNSGVAESGVPSEVPEPERIYARERPRLFGVPPQDTMLTLGALGLAVAFAAFATGRLVAGVTVLVVAYVVLGAFAAAMRRRPASVVARKAIAGARTIHGDVELVAAAVASYVTRRVRRARLQLERRSLRGDRRARLFELGEAVHEGNDEAAGGARDMLVDLDERIAANVAETEGLERRTAQQMRTAH